MSSPEDDSAESLERLRFARMRTELDPHDPEGHLELGWLLLRHGRLEAADEAFAAVLRIEPGDANALYLRAVIAQAWGQPERSARTMVAILRRFPQFDPPWHTLSGAVDAIVRRTHFYVAVALFGAVLFAIGGVGDPRGPAAFFLGLALVILIVRWLIAAHRLGARLLASLVRMRLRSDVFMRLSAILDGVAATLLLASLFAPSWAWKALAVSALAALLGATFAHAFQAKEP